MEGQEFAIVQNKKKQIGQFLLIFLPKNQSQIGKFQGFTTSSNAAL